MHSPLRSYVAPAACLAALFGLLCPSSAAGAGSIACSLPSPRGQMAAREVQRYVYVRTGVLLDLQARETADTVVTLGADPALAPEQFRLKTEIRAGRRQLRISGGSDLGTLYGAYRFAEALGVRFEVQADVIPDGRAVFQIPDLNETQSPLFDTRGIQPFHDFTEGPDWWTANDYKACLAQLVKMRMNFAGFHCYPEGGVGPEPLVWIGLPEDVTPQGQVRASYPSRWAGSCGGAWGYGPAKTSDYAAGAGQLFPADDFGSPVTDGFRPRPKTPADCNAVFDRAGALLGDAFSFGRALGVRTCIGTETPLHIPQAVLERLKAKGLNPKDPAVIQQLYTGIFQRIARTHPLDYYWLWTPENWTWEGNKPEQFAATLADIRAAQAALDSLGNPFALATCGWVLGPQHDRAALDRDLPQSIPMSCINRDVGFDFVEPAFSRIEGRPKWSIPWVEDDPNMTGIQLYAGRSRRDAADARAFGCTGLLGIHWRTRILSPNFAALAEASWNQQPWNPAGGRRLRIEPRKQDARQRGQNASFPGRAIAGTTNPAVYQTCVYDLDSCHVKLPNGSCSVTLQFAEPAHTDAGKRVFGVKLQGRPVIEHLDVFARAGADRALDLSFPNIAITNEELIVEFVKETEYPFIAGIVVEGRTAPVNQIEGRPFTRRINCGGPALPGYEADLPEGSAIPELAGRSRDLPCADFYAGWALAQFGPETADDMAAIFVSLDGGAGDYSKTKATRLPRPADWIGGPGGLKPNPRPWSEVKSAYAFIDRMAALRPKVRGPACLERFDYWLNSFRYHAALSSLGCARGKLDTLVQRAQAETNAVARRQIAQTEALPARLDLARQWEQMMTLLLQTVSTPGEMGTIANLEQHARRNIESPRFLELHDRKLQDWTGAPLPDLAQPGAAYQGPARLIVPTVCSVARQGEPIDLTAIVLDKDPAAEVLLHWRPLGSGPYRCAPFTHIARGVHHARLEPPAGRSSEYYITAATRGSTALQWPPGAPAAAQTVVFLPGRTAP